MAKVILTLAPVPCQRCHSRSLAVCYVGESWIIDKVVCGKCGFLSLKIAPLANLEAT